MKILHTSDWHIGKIVKEMSMLNDQRYIFEQMLDIIEEENIDAVIVAGDIYDRSVAPVEAVELLDKILNNIIIDKKIPMLVIAGNHDSAERIGFGSNLLRDKGLYIEGCLQKEVRKVVLSDDKGNINFYLVPYAEPAYVKHLYEDNTIRTHEDAMGRILDKIYDDFNESERNILIGHGYITNYKEQGLVEEDDGTKERGGLIISDSERPLSIGGTDLISASLFDKFDYVALGHLHGPQKVMGDRIRYSGSPLKYSFSEVKQKKSVTIIEFNDKGDMNVSLRYLNPVRDMRIIKGPLEMLMSSEIYKETNVDDYISAVITDKGEIMDIMSKLKSIYPRVLEVKREGFLGEDSEKLNRANDFKNKTKLELFNEFYRDITGDELNDESNMIIKDIIEAVEKGGV